MFSLKKWVLATFLGWILGVALLLLLASVVESIGLNNIQSVIAIGMGLGVGLTQWIFFRKNGLISVKWLWACVLGLSIPFLFFDLLSLFADFKLKRYELTISILLGGTLSGILQYNTLKHKTNKAKWWLIASPLGWMLSGLTVFSIDYIHYWVERKYLFAANLSLILLGGVVLGIITGLFFKKMQTTN